MRVEESSLTGYLVEQLQPLTPADPVILAEYVVALLKKDRPAAELQKLCNDSLVDFLGHSTKSFTQKLFQSLEDGSIVRPVDTFETIKTSEPSEHPDAVDRLELKSLVPKDDEQSISKKEQEFSSSPGATTDPEDKEVSDDDDDRNHKHRRRDPQPLPFDKDDKSRFLGRWKSKPDRPFENGHLFHESHCRPGENKREYNSLLDRDPSLKFGKRRTGMNPSQVSTHSGQWTPIGQTIWNDLRPPFDPNTSSAHPSGGRGRGRGTGPWSQHDSRFVPLGTLDFAPHMASQGLHHPSMFVGTGLPATANTQNAAWGGYGLVPGMPNVCMDPLRPLGLQGAMHSSINPQMNLSLPRQRCRDFEEQGFCLRGDMCPMEHGVNRIVVEDVQGLSQFNLPGSLPCTHASGVQKGLAPTNSAVASSSLLLNSSLPNRNNKSVVAVEGPGLNEAFSLAGGESDVYDPDQPLWNNKHPETSKGILRIPLPKADVSEPLWGCDSSDSQTFRLSDTHDEEEPVPHDGANLFLEGRGDVGLQSKMKMTGTTENYVRTATGSRDNESEDDQEEMLTDGVGSGNNGKLASTKESNNKALGLGSMSRFCKDARWNDRTSQKAWRTLFVCGVPQKNNKKETLLSHFEKFGKVIDIYIPMHSNKAFVQFSKREEAEAALKAPDAVMGNRFIKLFWANRDNSVDEKECSQGKVVASPLPLRPQITSSVHMKPTYVGGKFPPRPVTPKENNISSTGAVLPAVPAKFLIVNTPKTTITPKKRETLELLKEELRKKQEQLEQKRNDFRNQLDKLEKQAITASKQDPVAQQPVKKQKTIGDTAVAVSPITDPAASHDAETQPEAESMLDKSVPRDSAALPSPKPDSAMNRQSARSSVSRFKLDNRPTGFRILPPLPVELLDVAAIKKHFSAFGDLSVVEFEDLEGKSGSGCLEQPSPNFHVCVNFKTRRSAERAFMSGKCWQGHNLQFAWFTASSEVSAQRICPRSDTRQSQTTELQPGDVVVCGSLSDANVISEEVGVSLEPLSKTDGENAEPRSMVCNTIGVTDNGEGMDVDGIHCTHESNEEQSILTMLSSDKSPSKSAIPAVEDSTDIVSET